MSEDGPELLISPRGSSRTAPKKYEKHIASGSSERPRNAGDPAALMASVVRHHPSNSDGFSSGITSRVPCEEIL